MSDDKTWDNVQALLEYSGVLKLGRNAAGWWAWFGEVGRGGTYFRAYPTLAETVGLMPAPKTPPERDSKGEAELAAIVAERDQLRAALAAVPAYVAYHSAAWEAWGPGSPAPLDFAEWLAWKPKVQP